MSMRTAARTAVLVVLAVALGLSPTRAADYSSIPSGVPGGDPYGLVCPQGQRLVGLGLLIDAGPQVVQNLRPACAPIGFSTRWTGGQAILPLNASSVPANQTVNDSVLCPADTTVNGIAPFLSVGQPARIIGLRLTCRGLGNVRQTIEKVPGFGARYVVGADSACRSRDSGQGLWGGVRSDHVNRIGLICAENPMFRSPNSEQLESEVQRPGSRSGSSGGPGGVPTKQ
jgi:hypothetical protein